MASVADIMVDRWLESPIGRAHFQMAMANRLQSDRPLWAEYYRADAQVKIAEHEAQLATVMSESTYQRVRRMCGWA